MVALGLSLLSDGCSTGLVFWLFWICFGFDVVFLLLVCLMICCLCGLIWVYFDLSLWLRGVGLFCGFWVWLVCIRTLWFSSCCY